MLGSNDCKIEQIFVAIWIKVVGNGYFNLLFFLKDFYKVLLNKANKNYWCYFFYTYLSSQLCTYKDQCKLSNDK